MDTELPILEQLDRALVLALSWRPVYLDEPVHPDFPGARMDPKTETHIISIPWWISPAVKENQEMGWIDQCRGWRTWPENIPAFSLDARWIKLLSEDLANRDCLCTQTSTAKFIRARVMTQERMGCFTVWKNSVYPFSQAFAFSMAVYSLFNGAENLRRVEEICKKQFQSSQLAPEPPSGTELVLL